jgi:glyoxylase-like metal-dependent hydrolase (beta-lactamase superfamily II)
VRAVALHQDLIVFVSRAWQTTATAVRAGGETFLIDSVVYPDELAAIPSVLEQASFMTPSPPALLATHGDWDHLLGREAFPDASLGCGEATAARIEAELGEPQRKLRAFDEEQYVDGRPPLSLAGVQGLPVPGLLELGAGGAGAQEIQLHSAAGHTADGTAYWLPWLDTLVAGDYLSPVEIPMVSPGGSVEAYLGTLERFEPLVAQATTVIPGHGSPMDRTQAAAVLAEDLTYLRSLADDAHSTRLPASRRTKRQRQIHEDNVAAVGPDPD